MIEIHNANWAKVEDKSEAQVQNQVKRKVVPYIIREE